MTEGDIDRSLNRIAHEMLEENKGVEGLALVGIHTRGVYLARRLRDKIEQIEGVHIPIGSMDITLYRDDLDSLEQQPAVKQTAIDFDITDKRIVLVDDVLYTGRTVRAAIDELIDFGRPRKIQLAVLLDRGERELPIAPDYIGRQIQVQPNQRVQLRLKEVDGVDQVEII